MADHEDLIRRAVGAAITERLREKLCPPRPEPEGPLPPLRSLFPADFNPVAIAEAHGVREVRVGRGGVFRYAPDAPACYDPGTKTITLNPDIDREKVAKEIRSRAWVSVDPEHVFVFVVFHEVGHHARRAHLPARNGLLSPLSLSEKVETWEEEAAADEFARDLFYRWRIRRSRCMRSR